MFPLNGIAHIANDAASRRLQALTFPAQLDSELVDLSHLTTSVSREQLGMDKLHEHGTDMPYIPVAKCPQFCMVGFVILREAGSSCTTIGVCLSSPVFYVRAGREVNFDIDINIF